MLKNLANDLFSFCSTVSPVEVEETDVIRFHFTRNIIIKIGILKLINSLTRSMLVFAVMRFVDGTDAIKTFFGIWNISYFLTSLKNILEYPDPQANFHFLKSRK